MKGQIVRYNFLGLDTHDKEVFRLDYAIILNEELDGDKVRILPFTNRFNKESMESFCLGKVKGFIEVKNEGFVENNLYVRFDRLLDVPRADLHPVHAQDIYGDLIFDENGEKILCRINDDQEKILDEKYELYKDNDGDCAFNVIRKAGADFGINYEILANNPIAKHGFKPLDRYTEYNFNGKRIFVFYIKGNRYSVTLESCDSCCRDSRNSKIKELFEKLSA